MPEFIAFKSDNFLHLYVFRLFLFSRLASSLEVFNVLDEVSKPVSKESSSYRIQAFLSVNLSNYAFKARVIHSLLLVNLMLLTLIKLLFRETSLNMLT
jgi:hypothetical protein